MTRPAFGLLIVDDEPNIRSGLAKGLVKEADQIITAENAEVALEQFQRSSFALVILDVRLNSAMNGIELMRQMLSTHPGTSIIVITAHGTVETAVDAMRAGASDFIQKPLDLNLVRQQVRKARQHFELQIENHQLRSRLAQAGELSGVIGNSSAMLTVLQQVRQVATTEATVMIHGESGTGKELIARAVHDLSDRRNGTFMAVNLGALPETLLESELFGHEKGAFSGALRQKPGCFEQAAGGTLFLDEVTEMSPRSQVDLLRVLESQQYRRVGGETLLSADVRIVSATNRDTQAMIDEGTFREDLFYRLNVIPIEIPPLRNRRDDIPLLIEHFIDHFCKRHQRPRKQLAPAAMQRLVELPWPGNVRQLRNAIERLVVISQNEAIQLSDLPAELQQLPAGKTSFRTQSLAEAVEQCEKDTISAALQVCGMHREKSAQALGISVRTLHYKMNRYGLQ